MKNFLPKFLLIFITSSFLLLSILLSTNIIAKAGYNDNQYGNDFTVFYAASKNLYNFGDPYNHSIAAKTPYLYLPLFAFLLTPLAILPLPLAATIWYWLNILFSLSVIFISSKLASSDFNKQIAISILLLISLARLILDNLLWGQVNILVILLILLWLLAKKKNLAWWGELALATAIAIKITPALLAFYLLLKRRWQDLFQLTICFLTLNIISLIPLGNQSKPLLIGWFKRTILNGEGFNWAYAGNQSLRGAIERLFTNTNTEASYYPNVNYFDLSKSQTSLIFLVLAISLLSYYSYKVLKQKQEIIMAEVAACCSLMLLLSNLSWKAHFILLAIPLAVLGEKIFSQSKLEKTFSIVGLLVFFLLTSLTIQPIVGSQLHQWFETHSYYCVNTIIVFFLSLRTTGKI